jgi:hypothetical protein
MSGVGPWLRYARYRVGGEAAELFFWPIQKADTFVRKRHWQYMDEDDYRSQ